jgi:Ca2+-binding EF-hand superfamily protein
MHKLVAAAALAASAAGAAAVGQTAPPAPANTMPGRGLGMMRADANGDGVVTRAEATAQADAQFDAMDTNRDGKVTGEEMRAAFTARTGGAGGGRGMGGRFGNQGGTDMSMTRDDFRARALARFDRNDANHDGKVDAAEMDAARQMRMNRGGDSSAAPQQ